MKFVAANPMSVVPARKLPVYFAADGEVTWCDARGVDDAELRVLLRAEAASAQNWNLKRWRFIAGNKIKRIKQTKLFPRPAVYAALGITK